MLPFRVPRTGTGWLLSVIYVLPTETRVYIKSLRIFECCRFVCHEPGRGVAFLRVIYFYQH